MFKKKKKKQEEVTIQETKTDEIEVTAKDLAKAIDKNDSKEVEDTEESFWVFDDSEEEPKKEKKKSKKEDKEEAKPSISDFFNFSGAKEDNDESVEVNNTSENDAKEATFGFGEEEDITEEKPRKKRKKELKKEKKEKPKKKLSKKERKELQKQEEKQEQEEKKDLGKFFEENKENNEKLKTTDKKKKGKKKKRTSKRERNLQAVKDQRVFKYDNKRYTKVEDFITYLNEHYLDIEEISRAVLDDENFYGWLSKKSGVLDVSLKEFKEIKEKIEDNS